MADKSREYIYVEPEDYIPKDIYDMYFKDDDVMDVAHSIDKTQEITTKEPEE